MGEWVTPLIAGGGWALGASRGVRVSESMGEANAVDGRLGHSPDRCGRLGTECLQDRRDHVDDVRVLGTDLAACLDALRPGHQEGVAGTATGGLALPPPERGVARPGPAPRVMVEGRRAAEFVDRPEAVLEWLRG